MEDSAGSSGRKGLVQTALRHCRDCQLFAQPSVYEQFVVENGFDRYVLASSAESVMWD